MRRTCLVEILNGLSHIFEVLTTARLIAKRPHKDTHMVAHPPDVVLRTFHHSMTEQRYAGEFLVGMTLHVSLGKDIESVFVAKVVEYRIVRIVRCTHGIDVQPLHGLDVLFYLLIADGTSVHRREIMTVHPMKHHTLAVNGQSAVLAYLHLAKAHLRTSHIQHLVSIILQGDYQVVEVRSLCAPQLWSRDIHGKGRSKR